MRYSLLLALVAAFMASPALAEDANYYAPAPASQPAPQQLSDNAGRSYAQPPTYPPTYYAQPVPAVPQTQEAPRGDYGSSVMTDLRQLNF